METQNKKIAVFEVMILLVGIIAFTNLVSSYDGEGSESPLVKWMKDQIDSGSEENLNMGDLDEALCNEENCPSPEKKCNADGECVTSQPAGDNPVSGKFKNRHWSVSWTCSSNCKRFFWGRISSNNE